MIFDNQGIIGADISRYQGYPPLFPVVDFRRMKNYGFSFVILKATQGIYTDPAYKYNQPAASLVMPSQPYCYYDNTVGPLAQARHFWSVIRDHHKGIAWLDLEDRDIGDFSAWPYWYDFFSELKRVSNLPDDSLGIYTALSYWNEKLRSATPVQREYFHKFPLWLASYRKDPFHPDFGNILVPPPWDSGDVLVLQTGTPVIGLAAGVYSREIDYDILNGGQERLRKAFPFTWAAPDIKIRIRSNP